MKKFKKFKHIIKKFRNTRITEWPKILDAYDYDDLQMLNIVLLMAICRAQDALDGQIVLFGD